MGASAVIMACTGLLAVALAGFLYWRLVWFFRNPARFPPGWQGILSCADGTVVYVKKIRPDQDVLVIKKGSQASIKDIARQDMAGEKILIGVFMSPFNVHYNRSPLTGRVEFIRHYPAQGHNLSMWPMHLRTVLKRRPYYRNSLHVKQNERTVTKITGTYRERDLSCYVIQIAGRSVRGIDSYLHEGMEIERGAIFGMIRIGSQVDLVVPWTDGMQIRVGPGDKVRAGESILIQ
ncbi:phosphatidylserine decarboxylase [Desulfoferrobacter suflitae]|uniref:phosphatidylserine decarboxylase n=1 Tax=Desulfoferrobacter suflitae TaxID=2865782 RepID=UPI002164C0E2|nr:phosphatidylserine decarboxylase [Desulfoferrobacter suflitae]MCK8600629.1 phosphatidylserine decarboxylase [Desulfoferrobacter suflitae]